MSDMKDGGPAYPATWKEARPHPTHPGEIVVSDHYSHGMTIRDYFAAKAMQGIIDTEKPDGPWNWIKSLLGFDYKVVGLSMDDFAKDAYEFADAMLKARER